MSYSIWAFAVALAVRASAPPAPVVDGDVARALDVILTRHEQAGFCGGMLLARNGKILLAKGYGFADRARKLPFTRTTPFDIGSVTKQFTATGILHLAMEKKLHLDDHLDQFFPHCPDDKKAITLHHLLTHSAGMPDVFGEDYDVLTRQQFLDKALAAKLLWPPGTRYQYSNAGYSVLAAVIEIASKQPYEAYLRRTLWLPAGMEQTGYTLSAWDKQGLAHGYDRNDKDWGTPLDHRWDTDGPYWNLKGNGGILSTLEDLYRWNRAMKGEQILPEEWKKKMYTPHVAEGLKSNAHYGYGWGVLQTKRGTRLIVHNGGNDVFYDEFRNYIDEDVLVITASTSAAHSVKPFTLELLNAIFPAVLKP